MLGFLESAGMEPVDVWIERRWRETPVDEFLERMRVVASHVNEGLDPQRVEEDQARVRDAMLARATPRGFGYQFCKLFTVARKPG
ncbi:MAG: hypothetical protein ACR2N6_08870 [Miltoncostaeaceae bacterium]